MEIQESSWIAVQDYSFSSGFSRKSSTITVTEFGPFWVNVETRCKPHLWVTIKISPRAAMRGCKKCLTICSNGLPRVSCTSATCFAPGHPFFAPVQHALCTHTPKHNLHPVRTTSGTFKGLSTSSKDSGSQFLAFLGVWFFVEYYLLLLQSSRAWTEQKIFSILGFGTLLWVWLNNSRSKAQGKQLSSGKLSSVTSWGAGRRSHVSADFQCE